MHCLTETVYSQPAPKAKPALGSIPTVFILTTTVFLPFFLFLYSIKTSFLLPHFSVLGMEIAHFLRCLKKKKSVPASPNCLLCERVKVAQSCLTFCQPMGYT